MINIFNRKELFVTFRPEDYFRVKDILHANGIPHYTKFKNRGAGSRNRGAVSVGGNSTEYQIFVHKTQHETARNLIHR